MKIKNVTKDRLVAVSHEVEREGQIWIYTDYYLEDGRIVDSILRTEEGYNVEIPELFEEIQEFVGINSVA